VSALTRIRRIEAARQARIDAEFRAFGMRSMCAEFGVAESDIIAAIAESNDDMRRQGLDPKSHADIRLWAEREGVDWSDLEADVERLRAEFEAFWAERRIPA